MSTSSILHHLEFCFSSLKLSLDNYQWISLNFCKYFYYTGHECTTDFKFTRLYKNLRYLENIYPQIEYLWFIRKLRQLKGNSVWGVCVSNYTSFKTLEENLAEDSRILPVLLKHDVIENCWKLQRNWKNTITHFTQIHRFAEANGFSQEGTTLILVVSL